MSNAPQTHTQKRIAPQQALLETVQSMLEEQGELLFVNNMAVFQLKDMRLPMTETFMNGLRRALPPELTAHVVLPGKPKDDLLVVAKSEVEISRWYKNPNREESFVSLGLTNDGRIEEVDDNIPLSQVHAMPEDHRASRRYIHAAMCTR